MSEETTHARVVDAWLKQAAKDRAPDVLLTVFEAALGALWARTITTLGEVTLTAIAERVLHNASEKFPYLATLEIQPTGGIQFTKLREGIGAVPGPSLLAAIRFVLVEYLTVLGNLTAEILTPELHLELSTAALPKASRASRQAPGDADAEAEEQK